MKMFRSFGILFVVIAIMAAALPAAAQEGPIFPVELPEEIAEGREVTISVAVAISEEQDEQRERWDAQLERFVEKYPNVTVETVIYHFSAESFAALVAADNVPTLFEVPFTEPKKLIMQGIPADLTPQFEALGLADMYNEAALSAVSNNEGSIYGVPSFAWAMGIYYSIPMLEEAGFDGPPNTWEELKEMAIALTNRDEDVAGFAFNMAGGGGGWHFTNIAYGFGADIVRANDDGTFTATFGEGPAVGAMQFIKELRWEADVLPYDLESNPLILLVNGQAAMAMNPGDTFGWFRLNMPEVDLNLYGFAPMPAGPDGSRYSMTGGTARMINGAASEDEQEAAFVFEMWRSFDADELIPSREIHHNTQAGQGAPVLPLFAGEYQEAMDQIDEPYISLPVENYTLFFDSIAQGELQLVPEPAMGAQDFYAAIAEVLTTVLTDEGADVEALMAESAESFQTGILDQIE